MESDTLYIENVLRSRKNTIKLVNQQYFKNKNQQYKLMKKFVPQIHLNAIEYQKNQINK